MRKIKKKITVRFFSIDASKEFFEDFEPIHHANLANDKPVRFFNIREKKHLIKIYPPIEHNEHKVFFLSAVRERTTWQARAIADGTISGIHSNQGLIGDLYYYAVIPSRKMILGFTTGPSASTRSVANAVLQQFKKDRTSQISVEHISRESEYVRIKELEKFTEMRFSLIPSSFDDADDDMPSMFRELKASPFIANGSKLALTMPGLEEGSFTREDLLAAVDYLAGNDCCSALLIKGISNTGESLQLNLNKAYLVYSTYIQLRGNFVDEESAKGIIADALGSQNIL